MAALTEGIPRAWGRTKVTSYGVESGVQIWKGGALMVDPNGFAKPLAAGRGNVFGGFARHDQAGGRYDGETRIEAYSGGVVELDVASLPGGLGFAPLNRTVYATSDNDFTGSSANFPVKVGVTVGHIEGTRSKVKFEVAEDAEVDPILPLPGQFRLFRTSRGMQVQWTGGADDSTWWHTFKRSTSSTWSRTRILTARRYYTWRLTGTVYDFRVAEAARPSLPTHQASQWLTVTDVALADYPIARLATPARPTLVSDEAGVIAASTPAIPNAGGYYWSLRVDPRNGASFTYFNSYEPEFVFRDLTSGQRYAIDVRANAGYRYYDSAISSAWAGDSFLTAR